MQTLILEGVVRALTQISHNGGEINGNVAALRRMKVIQPDGKYVEVPHISGNSIRGKLRDVAAKHTLDLLGEEGTPHRVGLDVFQLMFSGGALTAGNMEGDIDKYREMRENLPQISLFGGAWGNAILSGKIKVNALLPIAKETAHVIPMEFHQDKMPSVFTYLQLGMYTRKENSKDAEFEPYIERSEDDKGGTSQMIYYVETLSAGTPFYWKLVLEDVTPEEFDFFVTTIQRFKNIPIVGGKGAVGFGQIDIEHVTWRNVTKHGETLTIIGETTESLYVKMVGDKKEQIKGFLKSLK
jgi:hypothetical protein